MGISSKGPTLYIHTEINFGDGPVSLAYSLDDGPITPALVRQCLEDTRDAALEKLERDRVARLLTAALGREATADEVALTRIGRGPMDAPDGERADAWLAKQGAC